VAFGARLASATFSIFTRDEFYDKGIQLEAGKVCGKNIRSALWIESSRIRKLIGAMQQETGRLQPGCVMTVVYSIRRAGTFGAGWREMGGKFGQFFRNGIAFSRV